MTADIPDKLFFKIGEVAKIVSLRPSVLRFWEAEFEALKPGKSRAGQRLYTKKELALIFEIKNLLYAEKLTIEGARKKIGKRRKRSEAIAPEVEPAPDEELRRIIYEVRKGLVAIRNSL
ncbi:MAG TPA: MerR family transcriptional regulator [Geobacteraceae bacterium]